MIAGKKTDLLVEVAEEETIAVACDHVVRVGFASMDGREDEYERRP